MTLKEWAGVGTGLVGFWIDHPLRGLLAVAGLLAIIVSAAPYFREVMRTMGKTPGSDGGGNVTINAPTTVNAPSQFGGQGNTLNVNQPAYFSDARIEQNQANGHYRTRVILLPSPGRTWAPGTRIVAEIRLDSRCRRWNVDPDGTAFNGVMFNVEMGPEENTDVILFRTTTPLPPGVPLVFDIEGDRRINVVSVAASPRGS